MATSLASGSSTDSSAQYTTVEIRPTADALILAFVSSVKRLVTFGTLVTPTLSSPGLTWELVDTVATADGERRLTCLRARGSTPARGAVIIGFADQLQQLCAWSIVEYTGVAAEGVNGSGAIGLSQPATGVGTRLEVTFTPADPAHDRTVAAILLQSTGQPSLVTPGTGFTEIHEQTPNQPLGKGLTLQTQDAAPGVATVGWTWSGNQNAVALVIGVKAVRADGGTTTGNPTIDLSRRYEPILHLHPSESFVPVNAKRYVEAAALWGATAPFDDKNGWGTTPLVESGQLSASSNEPGEFLGTPDLIATNTRRERFLELGGWKNREETPEAGVTTTSTNTYVGRTEILRRYGTDLADSRFWYHAELFDTARLKALATAATGGFDLSATLANFRNPLLLCYYLFYPAHDESVGTDQCVNIEAKEFASHAGDWHCFALLLDGEGPPSLDTYTPQFFGVTGSRPAPAANAGGVTSFRPYAFDNEGRVALKVEPWRRGSAATPVQPDVVDDHPHFYVARGSHSMYSTPGSHEVSPYEDSKVPAGCGRFDSPSAVPAAPSDERTPSDDTFEFDDALVLTLVKMCSGFLNPVGVIVGLVAGAIEGMVRASAPFGTDTPPFTPPAADPPRADAAPAAAGNGITVKPKAVTLTDVTDNVFDWASEQGVSSPSGRTYDFVVDRATQVWWPSDDGSKGFRGRWGQRVASDPVPHRAGVKFPEFWKMMLTALEQGFGEGTLPRPR